MLSSFVNLPDLYNSKNIRFRDLVKICVHYFGKPRIRGSQHIFKTPWEGDPIVNIQKAGSMAKSYQVKAVRKAIKKLKELKDE